jgi:adenylate cyclase class 2
VRTGHYEVEIKLAVRDAAGLRRRLVRLRAREVSPRVLEQNTLYDTPDGGLARHGQLIRLRTEVPAPKANRFSRAGRGRSARSSPMRAVLTYKGPTQRVDESAQSLGRRFKIRREYEVVVENGEQMRLILEALGLRPLFRYEKYRTAYRLPRVAGVNIDLDETPIGTFLELEGAPAGIDRAAAVLGYTVSEYILQSYGGLYIRDCRKRGLKPKDMLFSRKKSDRNRHSLLDKVARSI